MAAYAWSEARPVEENQCGERSAGHCHRDEFFRETSLVFAFFKHALHVVALLVQTDTRPTARPDEPKPAIDDRVLTPASWPGAEQKATPFIWGGGCCG